MAICRNGTPSRLQRSTSLQTQKTSRSTLCTCVTQILLPSGLSVQHLAAVDAGVSGFLEMSAAAARTILPWMWTCVCVCVFACVRVCVCVYAHARARARVRACVQIRKEREVCTCV